MMEEVIKGGAVRRERERERMKEREREGICVSTRLNVLVELDLIALCFKAR